MLMCDLLDFSNIPAQPPTSRSNASARPQTVVTVTRGCGRAKAFDLFVGGCAETFDDHEGRGMFLLGLTRPNPEGWIHCFRTFWKCST